MLFELFLQALRQSTTRTLHALTTLPSTKHGRLFLACTANLLLSSLLHHHALAANTQIFTPVQTPTPAQNLAVDQEGGWFYFDSWTRRGNTIRSGPDVRQCLLNLAKALEEVGVLAAAEYNGAAGALSLLPTAGALLGAPTREMWIVYKLVPLAGILSMFLSLGATITPRDAGEFTSEKAFSYGGLIATMKSEVAKTRVHRRMESVDDLSEARRFAREVRERADDEAGGDVAGKIWLGMACQAMLIGVVLVAMWFAQQGAVITWWCRFWGWIFFWYFLVIMVSIFDNIVAAPFTKSWTLRVAKAPSKVKVQSVHPPITQFDHSRHKTIFDRFKEGVHLHHNLTVDEHDQSTYSRTCFYVVISVEGISGWHAFAQFLSRTSGVIVFAFGTALFASATLMSISATLMLLTLVLPIGVIGRVAAMWIASQMNKHNKPILHAVVRTKQEASEHLEEILDLHGIQIETLGYVILDGNCLVKRNPLLSAATYIGLLATPYNLVTCPGQGQECESTIDLMRQRTSPSVRTAASDAIELDEMPGSLKKRGGYSPTVEQV